jgi:hypothetical protein
VIRTAAVGRCGQAVSQPPAVRGQEMARLKLIQGKGRKRVLVYGMRLFEAGAVAKVNRNEVLMADGRTNRITFHVIEGSISQIKKQLATSIDAFFDLQNDGH